jgi:3-hydroxybutyryl-CoA dehydratase
MSSQDPLYFEELEVGREWESPVRTITEADIAEFAALTGDDQPIHMDEEFAKRTPFQRRIAHGLLGLSIASGLVIRTPPMHTQAFLGLREWNFRAPIFIGDSIRVLVRVREKELRGRGRRGAVTWMVTVLNQDGRVVQEGTTATLIECSAIGRELILPFPDRDTGSQAQAV